MVLNLREVNNMSSALAPTNHLNQIALWEDSSSLQEIKKLSPSQELIEKLKKLTADEFQELLKQI